MEIFVREIGMLYAAFCNNQPSPLPELAIQYSNYVLLQRQWQREGKFEKQLIYWKKQLAGSLPVLELPADSLARLFKLTGVAVFRQPSRPHCCTEFMHLAVKRALRSSWTITRGF